MRNHVRILLGLIMLLSVVLVASAGSKITLTPGKGAITGTVIDKVNNEPLIGATVRVEGQTIGGITDLDGKFELDNVEPGDVTLVISFISYQTVRLTELEIKSDEITSVQIALDADDEMLEEIVVTAKGNRESEGLLLLEQKKSLLAVQAVGAMELSRKGISNAEAAVAQISGVSKQEGVKNVFVRGLGDRYNATFLNGFPIPSDDPEYKNIALEIFDTDMIQNIGVQKAFSASYGGDVGGAVINISSKELIGDMELEVSASGGANTSVLGHTFYKQDGTNYWGVSNSKQPESGLFRRGQLPPAGTLYPFTSKIQHQVLKSPIDHGFGLSAGKRYYLGDHTLSLLFVGNHNIGYSHTERISRSLNPIGNFGEDLHGPNSSIDTRQIGLGNITFDLCNKHVLQYNLLAIHSNNQYVAHLFGEDWEKNQDYGHTKIYRLQANDNLLLVNQIDTDWTIFDNLQLNAGASVNLMRAKEPDRRIFALSGREIDDEISWVTMASDRNDRFFSTLKEDDYNVKTLVEWNFQDNSYVRVGYIGRFVDHHFDATEYNHTDIAGKSISESDFDQMDWDEQFYNTENMRTEGSDYGFILSQGENYWYSSTKHINGAYVEMAYQILPHLTAQASFRTDWVYLNVLYGIDERQLQNSEIRRPFYLPSVNIKYDINDRHTIRLSGSGTYTLPQTKEISRYQYVNIGYVSLGNENLKPSDLWNADLKWDYYISQSELLSVTAFYKNVKNPMARVNQYISSGAQEYSNPSDQVDIAGMEVELKKNILDKQSTLKSTRHQLDLGLSGSYIWSHMLLNQSPNPEEYRYTMLEGSSPWLLNADLTYTYTKAERNYMAALLFSYFSDRIHTYGSRGITIATKGLQNDLMEEGMARLDFVASAKLTRNFKLTLKANNLIDSPYRRVQIPNPSSDPDVSTTPVVLSEYRKGVSFSLGASWSF